MKELVDKKLKLISKEITEERGRLSLFAFILREDAFNKWDLVVSAQWLNTYSMDDMNYIADKLKHYLEVSELLSISRIVILDTYDPIVQAINNYCDVEPGGLLELYDLFSIGLPFFKHAYILTSQGSQPVSVNVGQRNLRQTL